MRVRLRGGKTAAAEPPVGVAPRAASVAASAGSALLSQRQFLKALGAAVGLAGLAQVAVRPERAEAQTFYENLEIASTAPRLQLTETSPAASAYIALDSARLDIVSGQADPRPYIALKGDGIRAGLGTPADPTPQRFQFDATAYFGNRVGVQNPNPVALLDVGVLSGGAPTVNHSTGLMVGQGAIQSGFGSYSYPAEINTMAGGNRLRLQFAGFRRGDYDLTYPWKNTAFRLQYAVDNSYTDGGKCYVELGVNGFGGEIRLGTGAAGSPRLIVDASGNVGVGATAPYDRLTIDGDGAETTQFLPARTIGVRNSRSAPAVNQQIGSLGFLNPNHCAIAGISAHYRTAGDGSSGYLTFTTGFTADRVVIDSNGNVGIGVLAPAGKLDVGGEVRVNGAIAIGADGVAKKSYYAD